MYKITILQVLIRFENEDMAEGFYQNHQDQPYNTLEDSICHLAFVTSIEFGKTEVVINLNYYKNALQFRNLNIYSEIHLIL